MMLPINGLISGGFMIIFLSGPSGAGKTGYNLSSPTCQRIKKYYEDSKQIKPYR
jgi:tRNA A37 threonylcarbamoyladenosine biosynthesis protein TsaE